MTQSGNPNCRGTPMNSVPCSSCHISRQELGPLTRRDRSVLIGLRQEVWEGEDKGTCRQEETPYADHPRAVHPAAKVADKDDEDGIADLQRGQGIK